LGIKQSYLIIIISVVVVGAISSSLFVIGDLQSQVEELSKETEQQQSQVEELSKETKQQQLQLEAELAVKEQQQRELEEQQRELEREEAIRLQQQRELEEQQRELEEQQRELELQKRAQIEEMAKTNPLVSGIMDGELKFYIEPVPSYAADDVENGIRKVSNVIERQIFYDLTFKRVYNENDADIHISWIKNYGSHILGEAIFKSVVKIGLGSENCFGEWQALDMPTVVTIFWHEFGHSLGFGHSNDSKNIMYDQTDRRFWTEREVKFALDEGELRWAEFCSGGKIAFQASSDNKYNGFHVYILPPETDPANFINYDIGNYYPDCSTENRMVEFGVSCTVADGAKWMIYNPSDRLDVDLMRVTVKTFNMNEREFPDYEWDWDIFEYDENWINEIWNMYH